MNASPEHFNIFIIKVIIHEFCLRKLRQETLPRGNFIISHVVSCMGMSMGVGVHVGVGEGVGVNVYVYVYVFVYVGVCVYEWVCVCWCSFPCTGNREVI